MTFEEFQKTRTPCADLCAAVGSAPWDDKPAKGLLYLGVLYVEGVQPHWPEKTRALGKWHLLIGRCEWVTDDLESLERRLYDFAIGEGYTMDPEAEATALCAKWIAKFGLGFHPDTRGASYTPALSAAEVKEYDADIERLFEVAADPYASGITAWKLAGLLDDSKQEPLLTALTQEYADWNKANGLNLGSADEHHFDESLTDAQRAWLRAFSERWERAEDFEQDRK